jgi:hypothetical protein
MESQLSTDFQNTSLYSLDSSTSLLSGNLSGLVDPLQQSMSLSNRASSFSPVDLTSDSGIFTVGASGEVSFDYLFDGGAYKGELAIFSLSGMDRWLQSAPEFFAREAALRALSSSDLGHIVISDQTEGARFSGSLPYEGNFNSGSYVGAKTFSMRPGEQFGVMLVPKGTVEDVLLHGGELKGDHLPLFSIPTLNTGGVNQFAQVVDAVADGNSFTFEDLSLSGSSDRDYNDLVFQVQGATGQATLLDDAINPLKDWRDSETGQQIVTYATANKYGPLSKVGNDLAEVFVEYETHLQSGGSSTDFEPDNFLLQTQNDQVVIDAIADGDVNQLLADLQLLGLKQAASFGVVVSGSIPIEAMNEIAVLDSLRFARPAYRPVTRAGQVDAQGNTQGNRAINADLVRNTFGLNGAGVTVGVISDSYDTAGIGTVAADDVRSNDLPGIDNTNGFLEPVNVLQDYTSFEFGDSVSDEGRAMLQIVHDLAPGSNLAFHTGKGGKANFAQGIIELATVAEANVIVDDLGDFTEPFFQDGIVAQAVDQVVANGVAYFSAAGNVGHDSYESQFNAAPNSTAHDFDPSVGVDTRQTITIPAGTDFFVCLQWDSPFFSANPSSGGATSDLDVFLYDATSGNLLDSATNPDSKADAVEFVRYRNNSSNSVDVELEIRNVSGATPGLLKYIVVGNSDGTNPGHPTIAEYPTNSSTIFGHANARSAMAVGAAFYGDTPNFGQNPPLIETQDRVGEYGSSLGGTPILFDDAGNRLTSPLIRQNHMIVAPDGVNTTFFGEDIDTTTRPSHPNSLDQDDGVVGDGDNDTFPNFFGTSAAAPHAAAVAALMFQAVPGANPQNIYEAMENTAIDMNSPGFDYLTGFGLVQADAAIQELQRLQPPTVTINISDATASESGGDLGQLLVTRTGGGVINDLVVNYAYNGTATNSTDYSLSGSVIIPAGFSTVAIPVIPVDDIIHESNETVDISLQPSPTASYTIGAANQGTITILDDDPLTRRLLVSGSFDGKDDEGPFGGKDEFLREPIAEQKTILSQLEDPQAILNKVFKWGGELRVELSLNGGVLDESGNIQVTGIAKLFEGTTTNTNDLEDEQAINYQIPRGQVFSPTIQLDSGEGSYANIALTFDNTLGNNEEGFSGYPD